MKKSIRRKGQLLYTENKYDFSIRILSYIWIRKIVLRNFAIALLVWLPVSVNSQLTLPDIPGNSNLASRFELSTELIFRVNVCETYLVSGVLIADINGEIRGAQTAIVRFPGTGIKVYKIMVFNDKTGDSIRFKYYDILAGKIYGIKERIEFVFNQVPDYANPRILIAEIIPVFTQIGPLCRGSIAPALPASSPTGISGIWSPATISTSTSGTIIYTFTPAAGQCAAATTMNVTVNPLPTAPVLTSDGITISTNYDSGNQWYNSSGLISGATGKTYTPQSNGNYYAIVISNGCISTASNIISFAVGIEVNEVFKGISIYPNPAHENLIIENNRSLDPLDLEIINSNGIKVYKSIFNTRCVIDISKFSSGVYFIRLEKEGSSLLRKFIKE
jgi:hypothetical protein